MQNKKAIHHSLEDLSLSESAKYHHFVKTP